MKMVQIRNMPDDTHRKLKERAAREGTTMSDLLLREAERIAHQPSLEDVLHRVKDRDPVPPGPASSELVREDRDAR